ncbi:hypothetical protein WA1_24860 [Scytonema hofmannii PCC 7110]|uniref:Uncharacterized protein n=1 Tax=Scytonema hofmannii PCC 7110 TaxID=128403 RepID=A0A139X869_9CYAN|nr:hypothetical protein WA1_24860 [Scytonema hofmannii PCC 7110]
MGVRLTSPPAQASARFRDREIWLYPAYRRWLEIQPGIAIDLEGNPIIVDPSTDRQLYSATQGIADITRSEANSCIEGETSEVVASSLAWKKLTLDF